MSCSSLVRCSCIPYFVISCGGRFAISTHAGLTGRFEFILQKSDWLKKTFCYDFKVLYPSFLLHHALYEWKDITFSADATNNKPHRFIGLKNTHQCLNIKLKIIYFAIRKHTVTNR